MTDTESFNNIYLNLDIRKSQGKTDEYGNYIFEVEASNENLDLQNQIVLQNALLDSKEDFLRGGVISYDHLHKIKDEFGNVISNPEMVIGEPIDVKTNGKSTIVVGKLYAHNDKAKTLIKMLKDGSTRVRASVGGILPKIIKDAKNGVEKVTSVLWNDLALTTSPVNNTVGAAVFAKSLNSEEFVKALTCGYKNIEDTNGSALVKENIGNSENEDKEIIRSLIAALQTGEVKGENEAKKFLQKCGMNEDKSHEVVCEIIKKGGEMMKKSFSQTVNSLLKSLKGESEDKKFNIDDEDETIDIEVLDDDFENDEEEEDDEVEKSELKDEDENEEEFSEDDEDEETVDGTEVLKSLNSELVEMRKLAKSQSKMIKDLGDAVVGLSEMVYSIGGEKLPPRATLSKSLTGNSKGNTTQSNIPTKSDIDTANEILCRAVMNNEITIEKSSLISTDLQKSFTMGRPMNPEYYNFLVKEYQKGGK